jgi:hypothetical protein
LGARVILLRSAILRKVEGRITAVGEEVQVSSAGK